jgi:uncharacterized protein (TIRG00374 family)
LTRAATSRYDRSVRFCPSVRRLKIAVGVGISVVLIVYLFRGLDLHEVVDQLRGARWSWVGLAVLLAPVSLWARAKRWRYLFPPGADAPGLFPAVAIGYMANNVLPLRAGELLRVYVVARRWRRGFWTVVATLVVERVLDIVAIVLILAALIFVIPVPPVLEWTAVGLLALALVAVAALVFVALAPAVCRRLVTRVAGRRPALERRFHGILETFIGGLAGIRARAHVGPLLAWTTIVWIVPALAGWTMLAAMNVTLPWVAAWTILAFTGLGVTIPSAPGYIGVFHAAAVLALTVFGVSHVTAVGYAVVFHATQYVPVTLVGWLFLLREQLSLTSGPVLALGADHTPVSS